MKCPACTSARSAVLGGGSSEAVHEALNQVYRTRVCKACAHRWVTFEVEREELQRLRSLAHRALMIDAMGNNKREVTA